MVGAGCNWRRWRRNRRAHLRRWRFRKWKEPIWEGSQGQGDRRLVGCRSLATYDTDLANRRLSHRTEHHLRTGDERDVRVVEGSAEISNLKYGAL